MRSLREYCSMLGAVSFLTVLVLLPSSCVRVEDPLTGVQVSPGFTAGCARSCNDKFVRALAVATREYATQLLTCKKLPPSQQAPCVGSANETFEAKVKAANQQRIACINGCHRQGSGTGQ